MSELNFVQILTHFRRIEEVVAKLAAFAIDQHGYQLVVFRLQRGIGIDVDNLDLEMRYARLAAQGFQRGKHVVAEVAVIAAEQQQAHR